MPEGSGSVVDRYVTAWTRGDWEALPGLVSEDFVEEYPQSGERIRGRANFRGVLANIPRRDGTPGEVDPSSVSVIGSEDRWVMTPAFTAMKVEGTGDRYTVVFRARYADDSVWHVVSLLELRGGAIARATTFFGPRFEPAEWRAAFVETDAR